MTDLLLSILVHFRGEGREGKEGGREGRVG